MNQTKMKIKKWWIDTWRKNLYDKTIEVMKGGERIINVRSKLHYFNWVGAKYTIESRCIDVQEVYTVEWNRPYYFDVLVRKIIEEAKEQEIKNIACTYSFQKKGAVYILDGFVNNGFYIVRRTKDIFIVVMEL
jgi:hypothetical protein